MMRKNNENERNPRMGKLSKVIVDVIYTYNILNSNSSELVKWAQIHLHTHTGIFVLNNKKKTPSYLNNLSCAFLQIKKWRLNIFHIAALGYCVEWRNDDDDWRIYLTTHDVRLVELHYIYLPIIHILICATMQLSCIRLRFVFIAKR